MNVIWRFTLAITDRQNVMLPRGAEILAVQMQGGHPQLWALCDSEAPKEPREVLIIGTGNPILYVPGRYISTFQMNGGALVWHAFEGASA